MTDIHKTLRKVRAYIEEQRAMLIDSVTLSDGSIPNPHDGEVVREVDALIDEINRALSNGENGQ